MKNFKTLVNNLVIAATVFTTEGMLAQDATQLPMDPAVTSGKLENGLTYYIRQHNQPENRAALWLAVDAGSVLEDDDQRGLAHFVEHMAFNGTDRFEKNSMIDFAERAGIDFGADLNAYTSYDETVYMLTVPTDDTATLETGLDILQDWTHALSFDPEEVDQERGVVIEEWRRDRGPRQRISDEQTSLVLQGSQYVDRSPIGEKEILESAPVEVLQRYYQDWYRPDLMAVIVVGDIDPLYIEDAIKSRFNNLDSARDVRSRINVPVPLLNTTRSKLIHDPESSQSRITVSYKGPATPVTNRSEYRSSLIEALFSSMLNSRFEAYSQDPESPVLQVSAGILEAGRSVDLFQIMASSKPGLIRKSLQRIMLDIESIRRFGFMETELTRQKDSLIQFYERAHRERDKEESSRLAREIVRHFLHDETMPGIDIELEMVRDLLPAISIEEINQFATIWLKREDVSLFASGPSRDIVVTEDELLQIYKQAEQLSVQPYEDLQVTGTLIESLPPPGRIINEDYISPVETVVWTLSNGAMFVFKDTDYKNNEIQFQVISPGGLSLVDDDFYHTASFASTIMGSSGLGEFNETQINKLLTGKAVQIRTYIGETEEGLYGHAAPDDLETLMQLIHLKFTAQRYDVDAFQVWKNRTRLALKNRDLRPEQLFNEEYHAVGNNHHPRALPLELEDLENINLQKAFEFMQQRFSDASDYTFVFVGNLNTDLLKELTEKYIASIPAQSSSESWRDSGLSRPTGKKTIVLEKGTAPKSQVRLTWHADVVWSEELEMDLSLLEHIVATRLREVLREDLGGVYGVFTQASFYRQPSDRYTFDVGFTCAPENVASLRQAVFDVLDSIKAEGVSDDYLEKETEIQKRNLETSLQNNQFWLDQLVRHFRYAYNPAEIINEQLQRIERITNENLIQAANYFIGDNLIDGVLMPES